MIRYDVRAENVREMINRLKSIDPKLVRDFRRDLRGTAKAMATTIKSEIQVTPPLSGMGKSTPRALNWAGANTRVSISVAGSRKRDVTPLLAIKVDSPKGSPGYMAAETAGRNGPVGKSGSSRRTGNGGSDAGGPQGAHFIMKMTEIFGPLKGRGGNRIAWKYFWGERRRLNRAAMVVIDNFERRINEERL
jgi:hypothetical protein